MEMQIKPKEISLSPDLMDKMNDCKLDLGDGLQIYLASKRKVDFITSEKKKCPLMKKFYNRVFNVGELKARN